MAKQAPDRPYPASMRGARTAFSVGEKRVRPRGLIPPPRWLGGPVGNPTSPGAGGPTPPWPGILVSAGVRLRTLHRTLRPARGTRHGRGHLHHRVSCHHPAMTRRRPGFGGPGGSRTPVLSGSAWGSTCVFDHLISGSKPTTDSLPRPPALDHLSRDGPPGVGCPVGCALLGGQGGRLADGLPHGEPNDVVVRGYDLPCW